MFSDAKLLTFAWKDSSSLAQNPVIFNMSASVFNYGNFFKGQTTLNFPRNGIYYFSISVGTPAKTQVQYSLEAPLKNRFSSTGLVRKHTVADGIDTLSRDALLPMSAQDVVNVRSVYSMYSTRAGKYTSLAAFDFSTIMRPDTPYFMVALDSTRSVYDNIIKFNQVITKSASSGWDSSSGTYICPVNGIFVFSVSVLFNGRVAIHVELKGPQNAYVLRRSHTNHNSKDTLSRTVLMNCVEGRTVEVRVKSGTVIGNEQMSTSFMGFWYNPDILKANNHAWMVSRFSELDNSIQTISALNPTLTFSQKLISLNMMGLPMFGVQEIVCPDDGTYFVHITVESKANVPIDVYLRHRHNRKEILYAGIKRSTAWQTTGQDTLSRSMIVGCYRGDLMDVQVQLGSAIGKGADSDTVANAFLGFQISKEVREDIFTQGGT